MTKGLAIGVKGVYFIYIYTFLPFFLVAISNDIDFRFLPRIEATGIFNQSSLGILG